MFRATCSEMQSSIMTLGSGYRFYNLRRFFLNEDGFGKQKNLKRKYEAQSTWGEYGWIQMSYRVWGASF